MIARSLPLFIFILFSFNLYSQDACLSNFEVTKLPSELKDNSKIRVDIETSGAFICELYKLTGVGRVLVKSETGSGDFEVLFSNLSVENYYRVVVEFNNETHFLCKRRVIDTINLRSDD